MQASESDPPAPPQPAQAGPAWMAPTLISAQAQAGTHPPEAPGPPRYALLGLLGEGGMAQVHEAMDRCLERTVAVKILRSKLAADEAARVQFFREAQTLGRLSHPGLVAVYDAGVLEPASCYYAMQKVRGETLRKILSARDRAAIHSPPVTARLLGIFERVCQTMAYAHSERFIHRDLKPDNVMVDDFGSVYVMDWGISKRIPPEGATEVEGGFTQAGEIKGTPGHMSPEQVLGKLMDVDYRTDVFALGTVLYEILTGVLPFKGKSYTEVLDKVLHHEPEPPDRLLRGANRELSAICMQALHKDPLKRYPSARELAADVRCHREFLPVSAVRDRWRDRAWKWVRRRPILAGIGATLGFVLLAAALGWGLQRHLEQILFREVMLEAGRVQTKIEGLEGQLSAARAELAQVPEAERERREALQRQVAELRIRKDLETTGLREVLAGVIGRTYEAPNPEALAWYRRLVLEEIRGLVREGDLARARIYLEDVFYWQAQDDLLRWPPEQLEALRNLQNRVR